MIVFYTNSYKGKIQYQEFFDETIKTLQREKSEIISLEIGKYEDLLNSNELKLLDQDQIHHTYVRKGIFKSKAVVIDVSVDEFQLGYEASLALLLNKPVFVISANQDYSKRIKHPNFYASQYSNVQELRHIISDFLKLVKNKYLSIRFNGFLSPEQKNFLEWYGDIHHKNVSEVIREFIDEKITEYPDYEVQVTTLGLLKSHKKDK